MLTTLGLEWLLGIPPTMIRELLEAYQAELGIVLPAAGTVLDMPRTLTRKAMVVELALGGLSTREIARRIYHTPEAVEAYLRVFDRAVMLHYFGVPASAMPRITGHSPGLLKEHLSRSTCPRARPWPPTSASAGSGWKNLVRGLTGYPHAELRGPTPVPLAVTAPPTRNAPTRIRAAGQMPGSYLLAGAATHTTGATRAPSAPTGRRRSSSLAAPCAGQAAPRARA